MGDRYFERFTGAMLTAAGVLLMALSGVCSLTALAALVAPIFARPDQLFVRNSGSTLSGLATLLGMILLCGGLPFAVGWVMIREGRKMMKTPTRPKSPFEL